MRIVQIWCVVAVGLGVGLLVAGYTAASITQVDASGEVVGWSARLSSYQFEFYHDLAIVLKGFGAGLLTLGILGLLVPWINALCAGRCSPLPDTPTPPPGPPADPS